MTLYLLGLFSAAILGFCVLWAVNLLNFHRGASRQDKLSSLMRYFGWRLLMVGAVGILAITGVGAFSALLAIFILAAVFFQIAMMVWQMRRADQEMFTAMVSLAMKKGAPPQDAARAFARERDDALGARALFFADAVEAGKPFHAALRIAGCPLDWREALRAKLGLAEGNGTEAATCDNRTIRWGLQQLLFQRLSHIALLIACMFILSLSAFRFLDTMDDFFVETSVVSDSTVYQRNAAQFNWLFPADLPWEILGFWTLVALSAAAIVAVAYFLLSWLEWLPPRPWPLSWALGPLDRAECCRFLALAVDNQKPLPLALSQLSQHHPYDGVKDQLDSIHRAIAMGSAWDEALIQSGYFHSREKELLNSGERNGALGWTLRTLAEEKEKSFRRRCELLINIVYFCLLTLFAIIIAYCTVNFYSILAEQVFVCLDQ